jgi:hypothetical protein
MWSSRDTAQQAWSSLSRSLSRLCAALVLHICHWCGHLLQGYSSGVPGNRNRGAFSYLALIALYGQVSYTCASSATQMGCKLAGNTVTDGGITPRPPAHVLHAVCGEASLGSIPHSLVVVRHAPQACIAVSAAVVQNADVYAACR